MAPTDDDALSALRAENTDLRLRVKRLEEALARGATAADEARPVAYERIFDRLLIPLIVYRPDGLAVATNAKNLEFIGAPREAIVGSHNIFHDAEAREKGYTAAFERATRGEIARMPPTPYNPAKGDLGLREGRELWSETVYFPIHGADGIEYVVAINSDITERKRAEKAMRESVNLLGAITDNSPLLLYVKDLDGRYTLFNRRCEDLLGISPGEAIGKTDAELFSPEMAADHRAGDAVILAERRSLDAERVYVGPDGPRNILGTKLPILGEGGEVQAICGVLTDITHVRRAEAENLRLQDEMRRVHEETLRALSTPLIPIADRVVVMPLIGAVDRERAQRVTEAMLRGVAAHRAKIAILDVTGVPVADEEVAGGLAQTARAVRLLGAQVVLTGIQPEVAHALVAIGVDLGGVVTLSTLQDGIAYALRR